MIGCRYDRLVSELGEADDKPLRLDQDVREALLRANEGFSDSTYYSAKNFREQRDYKITGGALHVRSRTKTSWADSRSESEFVADDKATHRFLRERIDALQTEGVRQEAAAIKAARKVSEKAEREARANHPADDALNAEDDKSELTALDPHDEEFIDAPPSTNAKWIVAGALAIGGAVWVTPNAKRAWQAKARPRLDAWRTRRRSSDTASSSRLGEVPEPIERSPGDTDA